MIFYFSSGAFATLRLFCQSFLFFLEAANNVATLEHENQLLREQIKDTDAVYEARKQEFVDNANQAYARVKGELSARDEVIAGLKAEAEKQRQAMAELQESLNVHAEERAAVETKIFCKYSCLFLLRAISSESTLLTLRIICSAFGREG